ncbi:MAG TPA: TetR/AcrR family transcriptional regulator [Burkholderiaceae bacterium]
MAYQRTPYVESKRAEARQRLVQAAVALIERGGWREVQMSAVAAEAGLSTGAVYLHFPSKTDLLAEVYRTQVGTELHVLTQIAEQPVPAADRLRAGINAFAQRAMKSPRLAYALALEPTDIEVEEVRLDFHREFGVQFRRILDSGVAAGEFTIADTRVAAACIFGGIVESLMGPLGATAIIGGKAARAKRPPDATALVDGVLAFCFHGLGKPAPRGVASASKRGTAKSATKKTKR